MFFSDWPGHNPNAAAIVGTLAATGADLDAQAVRMCHRETLPYWACSNDNVAFVDALLDAGADIEHAGLINQRQLAFVFGCWLVERGARTLKQRPD
jgi:hypothetical protein